jgi:hypothetical protein
MPGQSRTQRGRIRSRVGGKTGLTVLGEGDARRRAIAAAAIVVGITLLALG